METEIPISLPEVETTGATETSVTVDPLVE
jgi:hypothetical protein